MSTKKTQNYQLHQWEPADNFLRTEFNENFTKLDAVLKTGLSGLEAGLGEKIGVVIGTYAGRQTTPEASTRRIELGFRPKMVLLASSESLSIGVLAIDQTVAQVLPFTTAFTARTWQGTLTCTRPSVKPGTEGAGERPRSPPTGTRGPCGLG